MIPTNLRLNFLTLCIAIVALQMSTRSVLSQVSFSSLPDQCSVRELDSPVRCGCYGYENELQKPEWDLLRKECKDTLNGTRGRQSCEGDFMEGGELQQDELESYFDNTFSTCAVPAYDLDPTYPYPTNMPSKRFVELSQGQTTTNFAQYFSGYRGVPSRQMIRMDHIHNNARKKLKKFCFTLTVFKRFEEEKARRVCCRSSDREIKEEKKRQALLEAALAPRP